jgi:hypothetical protein
MIIFGTGVRPNIIKGTKAVCTVSDKRNEDDKIWYARIVGKDENSMNVEVSGFYELVHQIKAVLNFNVFMMNNKQIENIIIDIYIHIYVWIFERCYSNYNFVSLCHFLYISGKEGCRCKRFQHISYCLALYSCDAWSRN